MIRLQLSAMAPAMVHGHDSFLEMPRDLPANDESYAAAREFEAFSRAQYGGLLNFLRLRVVNEEDARDAAQESLMRLMQYRDTAPEREWKPLLYRIAINMVGEQFRRGSARRADKHDPLDVLELASSEPTQEEFVVRSQQAAILREAILSLNPRLRQIYLLSRMQGMTYTEIAAHCEISVKTVEKHMTQALAELCARVGSGGSDAL